MYGTDLLAQFTFGRFIGLLLFATAAAWSLLMLPAWRRSAERRGGHWYLEALLLVNSIGAALATSALSGTSVGGLLFWIGVGLAGYTLLQAFKAPRANAAPLMIALILFYVTLFLSSLFGAIPSYSRYYWATALIIVAFVAHGGYTLDWLVDRARTYLRILIAASLVTAVIVPGMAFATTGVSRTFIGLPRLQGIIAHPNGLAAAAALLVLFEVARRPKGLGLFWLMPPLIAISLAQSTTAWISLLIGLPFLASTLGRLARRMLFGFTVALSVAMFFSPGSLSRWLDSFLPENWQTLTGRTEIWEAALQGFHLNNWFGYGPTLLDETYRARWIPNVDAAGQAHNQFVQTTSGEGYLGAAALVVLVVVLAYFAIRYGDASRGLALAVSAVFFCRMMSETPLRPGGVNIFTFFALVTLGLVASSINKSDVGGSKDTRRNDLSQFDREFPPASLKRAREACQV